MTAVFPPNQVMPVFEVTRIFKLSGVATMIAGGLRYIHCGFAPGCPLSGSVRRFRWPFELAAYSVI
jgi:hypothetical protein